VDTLKKDSCLCDLLTEIVWWVNSFWFENADIIDIIDQLAILDLRGTDLIECIIIFNKCLDVGSLEIGDNNTPIPVLCTSIVPVV
jgi:hypothetical protein